VLPGCGIYIDFPGDEKLERRHRVVAVVVVVAAAHGLRLHWAGKR
jgi:hypothetical protein